MSAICERVACEASRAARRSALRSAASGGGRAVFSRESRAELLRGRYSCSMRRANLLASLPHFDVAHREAATHGRVRTPMRPNLILGDPIGSPGRERRGGCVRARHRTCGDWGRSQRQRTRQGCPYFNCNRIYTCVDALYDVTRDGAPDRRTRPRSRRPPRGDGTRDRTGRARSCSRKERRRAGIHRR